MTKKIYFLFAACVFVALVAVGCNKPADEPSSEKWEPTKPAKKTEAPAGAEAAGGGAPAATEGAGE